ncbi:hypothetical protein F0562_015403 [Nyssa sinensis]|uniref:non-specific serine/threonine protein kinase n=1 Tax=Nyssa sinensis TaxID=561372 RepID=A0A5J4ZIN5_9ASTE|nr:hypothetical protein F0562_015403 [Nyssa sinensis]
MFNEGLVDICSAIKMVDAQHLEQLLHPGTYVGKHTSKIGDFEFDLRPIECRRELECRDPLLRQPFLELDYEGNSFGDGSFNGFCNGVTFETDKEGHIRNIYFPFDIESDTTLSVAIEMAAELDITDQNVTKITDMIDGEIVSLVPEWKPRPGIEETPRFANLGVCHNCASNHTSDGSFMNFLSKNPSAKDLQILQCSGNGCAAMHGRFEEITYQVDGLRIMFQMIQRIQLYQSNPMVSIIQEFGISSKVLHAVQ